MLKGFPETIVELNEILETPQFKNRDFIDVRQELNIPVPDAISINSHDDDAPAAKRIKLGNSVADGTKVMALPTGSVPCNKHLLDVVQVVKPHIRRLLEDSNLVRLEIIQTTMRLQSCVFAVKNVDLIHDSKNRGRK